MAKNVWWCSNCGYEIERPGICQDCGAQLLAAARQFASASDALRPLNGVP